MILDLERIKIYVKPGSTDMRKQINGLAIVAQEEMELDVFSGSLFLFCNRPRKILKALYWDRTGFAMWQKRLEKYRFPWPETEQKAQEIGIGELKMLLEGIDFWHAHQEVHYESIL
jgi:transposase